MIKKICKVAIPYSAQHGALSDVAICSYFTFRIVLISLLSISIALSEI